MPTVHPLRRPLRNAVALCALQGTLAAATLNVTSYGAVPNGTGDYTAAIQAAINAANAGDTVFIPAGTYRVSGTINTKTGTKLHGANRDTAILRNTGTANHAMVGMGGRADSEVAFLTLDGANIPNTQPLIAAANSQRLS